MPRPEDPAPDQTRQAKAAIAAAFGSVAPVYDQSGVDFFGMFARRLVEHLAPEPGWQVVDVGSGRGAVVFPLVDAVGASGRVTAVDLAEPMIHALAADLMARAVTTVDTRVGDVETLDLPEQSADAVTASMVLFFLPDLDAGLRAIRRVLRPGGRLAFTVFGDADPRWRPVYGAFLRFLPNADPDEDLSRPRHPQLASDTMIRAAVEAAGFEDVRCLQEIHPVRFASVEQWHDWSWSCGLRGVWMQIPDSQRAAARAAVLSAVEECRDGDGALVEDFGVRFLIAHRPL